MSQCDHEINLCAGYGATIGRHVCKHCHKTIVWLNDKYVTAAEITEQRARRAERRELIETILWGLATAAVLAFVSVARHW